MAENNNENNNQKNTTNPEDIKVSANIPEVNLNTNLGSFTKTVTLQELKEEEAVKPIVADDGEKIDFSKFQNNNRLAKKYKPDSLLYRFRVWLDKILNHKKLFVLLWMSYIVAYIAVFIITITMSIYVGGCANHISDPINKLPPYPGFSNTSIVFNYISIIILLLPIAVLLITWIIGINGVPRSANFHTYVIISLLLVSLLLITSLILGISYIIEYNSFVRFPAAQA